VVVPKGDPRAYPPTQSPAYGSATSGVGSASVWTDAGELTLDLRIDLTPLSAAALDLMIPDSAPASANLDELLRGIPTAPATAASAAPSRPLLRGVTPGSGCTAIKGTCGPVASCTGTVTRGLCPGACGFLFLFFSFVLAVSCSS
jgi:hypothetical protein